MRQNIRYFLGHLLNDIGVFLQKISRNMIRPIYPELKNETYFNDLCFLHRKIQINLNNQKKLYPHYIYEQGYLYQGFHSLGIFGVRSTERRYYLYNLDNLIHESDTILDIGCNCGFMLIYASYRKGCSGDGIDINPFMINIGRAVTDFLELSHKIRLFQDSFLLFQPTKKYSVIFSFAAYWTDDGLLRPDFDLYMRKMHELLYDGGIIIFETHSNDANNPEFHKKMENFRDIFSFDKGILLDNNERELFFLKKI